MQSIRIFNERGTHRPVRGGGVPLCILKGRRAGRCLGTLLLALGTAAAAFAKQAAKAVEPAAGYLSDSLGQMQAPPAPVAAPSLLPTLLNIGMSLAIVILMFYGAVWLYKQWMGTRG